MLGAWPALMHQEMAIALSVPLLTLSFFAGALVAGEFSQSFVH